MIARSLEEISIFCRAEDGANKKVFKMCDMVTKTNECLVEEFKVSEKYCHSF